jgi:hypothetical protein
MKPYDLLRESAQAPNDCNSLLWRKSLLRTVAASAICIVTANHAIGGPDVCVIVGNVATCQGNQSAGISEGVDFTAPPVDTLIVNNLNQDIAPLGANDGIHISSSAGPFTMNVDTGLHGIASAGVGIHAIIGGTGNGIAVDHAGNITAGFAASAPCRSMSFSPAPLRSSVLATSSRISESTRNLVVTEQEREMPGS